MSASQSDCIFCKIVSGEISVPFIVESDHSVAFLDQAPMARDHVLVVPKRHLSTIHDVGNNNAVLVADLIVTANKVADIQGITTSGYRIVTNVGRDAGQTVFHLHLHVLGGESLGSFGRQESTNR